MKAFVEVLSCIVRAGPDCDRYGKPFDFAVGVSSIDGQTAIIKALVNNGDIEFTSAHRRAAFHALKQPLPAFVGIEWERFKIGTQAP